MEFDVANLYPLTSLQIGDVQSYLSQAYLLFVQSRHRFLILIDNHSWRMNNNHSRSTHLRELFATKYRTSPFKNNKALVRRLSSRYRDNSISSDDERKKLYKWVSVVNKRRWRETAFFSLVDLHLALHGFIVFEVYWKEVRGINYYNELQSDTSMAFEVKSMRKWDFHSIDQASHSIQSWFSGTPSDVKSLWECLMFLDDKVPSHTPRKTRMSPIEHLFNNRKQNNVFPNDEYFDVNECIHHGNDPYFGFFKPVFGSLWELCRLPVQVCSGLADHAVSSCGELYEVLQGVVIVIVNRASEVSRLATRVSKAKPNTTEVSMWNLLWKDLFAKVFRSLKSILYGLIAFLNTCNRHRLSTSNHLREYIRRMYRLSLPGLTSSKRAVPEDCCQEQSSERHEHFD